VLKTRIAPLSIAYATNLPLDEIAIYEIPSEILSLFPIFPPKKIASSKIIF